MQSVTRPRLRPSRRIEWISLVVSTAPVAPIGWPRRDRDRKAGMNGLLPVGIHLPAGLHDVAHDTGFHLVRLKPGSLNRDADRHSTESRSWHVPEAAAKSADSGANWFGKND